MDRLTVTETVIALETAALEAWHKGNPHLSRTLFETLLISTLHMKGD